jgi:cytochrome c-550 PedF
MATSRHRSAGPIRSAQAATNSITQSQISMNTKKLRTLVGSLFAAAAFTSASQAYAHGDVTPQAVDVSALPALKNGPLTKNPYVGNAKAIEVGSHAFGQNCARCHGLGAVSGGIAPDLRYLPTDAATDEYFQMRVRNGSIRNGVTYMPPFGAIFSEEAIWALRSYLVSLHVEQ